jgi:hypothetical protein
VAWFAGPASFGSAGDALGLAGMVCVAAAPGQVDAAVTGSAAGASTGSTAAASRPW